MVGTELVKTHGRFKIYFVGDGGIAAGPHARRTIGARRAGRGGCDRHHPVAGQCPERTVHWPDDFARVAREMRGPRDMVPIKPDRGAWDRTATAAGQQGLTFIEYHTMFDVDGTPNGVVSRSVTAGELGRPPARLPDAAGGDRGPLRQPPRRAWRRLRPRSRRAAVRLSDPPPGGVNSASSGGDRLQWTEDP